MWRHAGSLAVVETEDRVAVLDLEHLADPPRILEGSAAAIWKAVDGVRSAPVVVESVAESFGVQASDVRGRRAGVPRLAGLSRAARGLVTLEPALRLRAEEAVPLAHALVARVASDHGLRVLAIKGPAVAEQGLREARDSADVDVLVHPRDLEPLVGGLTAVGWKRMVTGTYASIMPPHSVNVLNDHWPIGIDVHHYFPGFLADAGQVFEALWARHELINLAGVPVPACDPVGQVAIVALHHLRVSPGGESDPLRDLAQRARVTLSTQDLAALIELAQETDATGPLRPFLLQLGVAEQELAPVHAPRGARGLEPASPPGRLRGLVHALRADSQAGVAAHAMARADAYSRGDLRLQQRPARRGKPDDAAPAPDPPRHRGGAAHGQGDGSRASSDP